MSAADEILADLPMDQLAAQLGTDPATAEQAVRTALPALFGGLQANVATDEQGGLNLAQALTQHSDPRFLDGGVALEDVDSDDGHAIVQHIFANSPDQLQTLQAGSGGTAALISKLLPILAPIVMAYIAKKLNMGNAGSHQSTQPSAEGGLGDLLGPILGGLFGGGAAAPSGGGSGGFGDILGQILGGQTPQPQQAPVQQHDNGQFEQPQFNRPGTDDGRIVMPTAEEDDGSQPQNQQPSGGIGDILGGIFGR
jgi:hypothetical protein